MRQWLIYLTIFAFGLAGCQETRVEKKPDQAETNARLMALVISELHQCGNDIPIKPPSDQWRGANWYINKDEIETITKGGRRAYVPVRLSPTIATDFLLDSGADQTSISFPVIHRMFCEGSLKDEDILGITTIRVASDQSVYAPVIKMPRIDIERASLRNIPIVVLGGESLFGVDVIAHIDLERNVVAFRASHDCERNRPFWNPQTQSCSESMFSHLTMEPIIP